MRRCRRSNDFIASRCEAAFWRWQTIAALSVVACCLIAAVAFTAQQRRQSSDRTNTGRAPGSATGRDVYAAWYEVPVDSLARRRAGLHELTAAHNRLPLGTRLRVTHLENGRSVIVHITDRGIHKRGVKLDVCKEAAVELDMISKGIARVRIEVIGGEQGASPPELHTSAPSL